MSLDDVERKAEMDKVDVKEKVPENGALSDAVIVDLAHDVEEGVDQVYELKSELINRCMQNEIGMGRYQWELFLLSGFGWAADNIWLQGVAIVLPSVGNEFVGHKLPWVTFSLYAGLILGATTWGILADIIGRRLSWNITLFLCAVFGIAAGGAPNFTALAALIACMGFGVGGNLPVDGALFLEFIPQSHQYLLTLLSAFWSLGQLIASLIAWAFIANYSCTRDTNDPPCARHTNQGWRYTLFTLGALTFAMWVCRYIIFSLQESPKYLIAKNRDEEAIRVLEYIARRNGTSITLTAAKLRDVDRITKGGDITATTSDLEETHKEPSAWEIVMRHVRGLSLSHFKPLFSSRRLAFNTSITIALWGLIGLAYPLYNAFLPILLAQHSAASSESTSTTYRNYTIISVCGIPGSIIAAITVDWTRKSKGGSNRWSFGGRKATMAVATALTGVFLFLFTTAKGNAAVLGYNCASGLTQNAMYGVLYAYTPEVFPAPHRGTGDAVCSATNRILGILAPIIAIYGNLTTSVPVYVSASLFLVASVLMVFLPIETAGKAAL